jgi:hypothetical protein
MRFFRAETSAVASVAALALRALVSSPVPSRRRRRHPTGTTPAHIWKYRFGCGRIDHVTDPTTWKRHEENDQPGGRAMSKDLSPWGPRHATEPTHEKTYDLAEALGLPLMHAYGHLSAFRARILTEAPSGRLRGGPAEVERLALWTGPPGVLAAAFLKAGIVDEVGGVLEAHEHPLYGGASIEARNKAAERGRERRSGGRSSQERSDHREVSVSGTACQHATPPPRASTRSSPHLSCSSSSSEVGGLGEGAPPDRPQAVEDDPRLWWRTAEDLMSARGRELERDNPMLDGKGTPKRPTVRSIVKTRWRSFEKYRDANGQALAFDALAQWVAEVANRFRVAWERDQQASAVIADDGRKAQTRALLAEMQATAAEVAASEPGEAEAGLALVQQRIRGPPSRRGSA